MKLTELLRELQTSFATFEDDVTLAITGANGNCSHDRVEIDGVTHNGDLLVIVGHEVNQPQIGA